MKESVQRHYTGLTKAAKSESPFYCLHFTVSLTKTARFRACFINQAIQSSAASATDALPSSRVPNYRQPNAVTIRWYILALSHTAD